ncbi:MAG: protein-L-isoaspartate O-methyltransferase [Gammaproteobacteria bacterium]|nr:protein-L-isoaspartate O-methyltransferase [Gammaproteobacteria bacterium]
MDKQTAQTNMIKQQLRTGDITDGAILDLYETIPRDAFVPPAYQAFAYSDMHIPLDHDQCMFTPLEEASLLQALQLQGHETVLEIGTGTGFLTALLSNAAQHVLSIDYFEAFTAKAKKSCKAVGCHNIDFITGDGCQGWVDKAPYDIVVLTGGIKNLTDTLKLQVLLGGKIFTILGTAPIMEGNLHQVDHEGQWTHRSIFETNVPSLINKQCHQPFVF